MPPKKNPKEVKPPPEFLSMWDKSWHCMKLSFEDKRAISASMANYKRQLERGRKSVQLPSGKVLIIESKSEWRIEE